MRRVIRQTLLFALALFATTGAPAAAQGQSTMTCSDFATQAAAQDWFEANGGPAQDPTAMDADGDGAACEWLPCPCRGPGSPPPPPPPPPVDTDGDGLDDTVDACPTEAADTKDGCPAPAPLPVYAGRFDLGGGDYSPLGTPQRKPRRMTPFIADANAWVIRTHWRGWGASDAIGKGTARVNKCRPSCADGRFVRYPGARVELDRQREGECRGQPAIFYTRARFIWPAKTKLGRTTAKLATGCGGS
jgi:hypothetical protein